MGGGKQWTNYSRLHLSASHAYNLTEFTDQLNNIIKSINPNKYHAYLCGDFNIDSQHALSRRTVFRYAILQ